MNPNHNLSQEDFETIERYLTHTMSADERHQFETKLASDQSLKKATEEHRLLIDAIETQALNEHLDDFHSELPEHTNTLQTSNTNSFWLKRIAIAAILILSISSFWFFSGSTNSKLYAKYFTPDPGLPTTMGTTSNYEFFDAMVNYKQGDYKTAISKWKTLEQKTPENDTLNYFLGVAHLADKKAKGAIGYLNKTVNVSESVFTKDAYYYLGLAYLKSDQTDEAIQAFLKSHSEKSKDILKALK